MRHKGVSYAKYGYLFSLPFIIVFLFFSLYPILYTIILSFTDLRGMTTKFSILKDDGKIAPFGNFVAMFENESFKRSISNTVIIWVMNFIPQVLLALIFAAWFTNKRLDIKHQGVFKVLFYMPNIITAATIALLFNVLFSYPGGVINYLRTLVGLDTFEFTRFATPTRIIIAFIQFWMWYGYTMLVLISGILGINPELYEAAEIDGASSSQTFFKVTLPNLRTIMIFIMITSLIGGMQMFDIPMLFNQGNPTGQSETVSMFIYTQAFSPQRLMARSAAASLMLFLVIVALSIVVFRMMRDKQEVKEKKIIKAAQKGVVR